MQSLETHLGFWRRYDGYRTFLWDVAQIVWCAYGTSSSLGKFAEKVAMRTNGERSDFEDRAWEDGFVNQVHGKDFREGRFEQLPNQFDLGLDIRKHRRRTKTIPLDRHKQIAEGFAIWAAYLEEVVATYSRTPSMTKRFKDSLEFVVKLRGKLHSEAIREHQTSPYPQPPNESKKHPPPPPEVALPFEVDGAHLIELIQQRTRCLCTLDLVVQIENKHHLRRPIERVLHLNVLRVVKRELTTLAEQGRIVQEGGSWYIPSGPLPPKPLPPTILSPTIWDRLAGDEPPVTPETLEEGRAALSAIRDMYPLLTIEGMGNSWRSGETSADRKARWARSRDEMLTDDFVDQFMRACGWIENAPRIKTPTLDSYHLKHIAEDLTGGYIRNAMLIAAGLYKRIPWVPDGNSGSTDVRFAISRSWIRTQELLRRQGKR